MTAAPAPASEPTEPDTPDLPVGVDGDGAAVAAHAASPVAEGLSVEQRLALLFEPARAAEIGYKPIDVNAKWSREERAFILTSGAKVPGVDCGVCGQWLPQNHKHLTFMGHAAVTARLLRIDPHWSWEPAYRDTEAGLLLAAIESGNPEIMRMVMENSLPRFLNGGMWIRLTVLGETRLGFGDAGGKDPSPAALKEIIGDAIRNAAMRFGVGLDLWNKGEGSLFDLDAVPAPADVPAQGSSPIPPRGQQTDAAKDGKPIGIEVVLSTLESVRGRAAWQALRAAAENDGLLDREVTWKGEQMSLSAAFDARAIAIRQSQEPSAEAKAAAFDGAPADPVDPAEQTRAADAAAAVAAP